MLILETLAILSYAFGVLALTLLAAASLKRRLWCLSAAFVGLGFLFVVAGLIDFRRVVSDPVPDQSFLTAAGRIVASISLACLLYVSTRGTSSRQANRTRFRWLLIGALAPPAAALSLGLKSGILALSCLPLVVLCFVATVRSNVFGMLIRRRSLFLIVLGATSALYLIGIKALADSVSERTGWFGSVIEFTLVLGASILWLPLLSWISRVLDRRTELYSEFGKRVIDEAAVFLDPEERAAFLAKGIRRLLNLRAVELSVIAEPLYGTAFGKSDSPAPDVVRDAAKLLESEGDNRYHRLRTHTVEWTKLFSRVDYNYAFPIRYQGRLTGILWLDSSPRQYLDEYEPFLLDLCRQIGHSLEALRLIGEKLVLERSLLAQQHLAALGNVAAIIAHEVKNPLSSIRALTQLMGEDQLVCERYGQDLKYIMGETDRLNASVRQILTFARPASDIQTDVDFTGVVARIAETLRKEKAGDPLELHCEVTAGLVLPHANEQAVEQIVWNLLLNAIQALEGRGRVEVVADVAGDGLIRFSVRDDGPGISPSARHRIFEPYFTTRQKGTGLGLSIVQKNVRDLNGTIELTSPVSAGRGAHFAVLLPGERVEGLA